MVKYFIISFYILTIPIITFSQMTAGELIKIYNMDRAQFEQYAVNNNYTFYENQNTEKLSGVRYKKGLDEETKFLMFQDKFYSYGKCVNYQTWSDEEYMSLIKNINQYGFVFFNTKQFESRDGTTKNRDSFRNNTFELSIFITPKHNEGYNRYEISLIRY